MIRVDQLYMAVEPLDMRGGMDRFLSRVVGKFGSAKPHTAYCFINRDRNRIKVLVHDGFGLWLAVRRLHSGRFIWAEYGMNGKLQITAEQFNALVIGLPWKRVGADSEIRIA